MGPERQPLSRGNRRWPSDGHGERGQCRRSEPVEEPSDGSASPSVGRALEREGITPPAQRPADTRWTASTAMPTPEAGSPLRDRQRRGDDGTDGERRAGHDVFVDQDTTRVPGVTINQEGGQLLVLGVPGS
jgi:hypothetical protein